MPAPVAFPVARTVLPVMLLMPVSVTPAVTGGIGAVVPVPLRFSVYGFSSLSLLAMLRVAVFAAVEDGVNVTVKVVLAAPATGVLVKV